MKAQGVPLGPAP